MAILVHLTTTAQLAISFTTSDYNGYQVSCFGQKDGAIDATVSGGTAPYSYTWSNGATTEDLTGLPAGYYKLTVMDADSTLTTADITLVEPTTLKVQALPFTYPNGHNISCQDCYNGSIDVSVFGGVEPYTYSWNDGATTQDRSGLGALKYIITVTDANGCATRSETVLMTQPDRHVWDMQGNSGSNPATHYIGTADAQDMVFKSNGQERLRVLSNGNIKLSGSALEPGVVYLDENGVLRGGGNGFGTAPPMPVEPCATDLLGLKYWSTVGNSFAYPQCDPDNAPVLGTNTPTPLSVITNGNERIRIAANGKVGIGTVPPVNSPGGYSLFVEGGIATRDVMVKTGPWPDFVFDTGYDHMPLSELRAFVQRNRHLPGIPSASEVDAAGGVEVGDLQRRMLETIEQQALYILQLEARLQQLEQRVTTLQTSR